MVTGNKLTSSIIHISKSICLSKLEAAPTVVQKITSDVRIISETILFSRFRISVDRDFNSNLKARFSSLLLDFTIDRRREFISFLKHKQHSELIFILSQSIDSSPQLHLISRIISCASSEAIAASRQYL